MHCQGGNFDQAEFSSYDEIMVRNRMVSLLHELGVAYPPAPQGSVFHSNKTVRASRTVQAPRSGKVRKGSNRKYTALNKIASNIPKRGGTEESILMGPPLNTSGGNSKSGPFYFQGFMDGRWKLSNFVAAVKRARRSRGAKAGTYDTHAPKDGTDN